MVPAAITPFVGLRHGPELFTAIAYAALAVVLIGLFDSPTSDRTALYASSQRIRSTSLELRSMLGCYNVLKERSAGYYAEIPRGE